MAPRRVGGILLTIQPSPAMLCAVIPGLDLEGEAARIELVDLACRNGVTMGFAGSASMPADLDLVISGSVSGAIACSPALWVSINPRLQVIQALDINAASRVIALALDGWPEGEAVSPANLPAGVSGFHKDLEQNRPSPSHPLLSLLARPEGTRRSAVLPLGMFSLDNRHASRGLPRERLGLAGRARYLLHGAYHWLPRGSWTATIVFAVDQDAAGGVFRIEWGAVNAFSQHIFRPTKPGRYEVSITSVLDQAAQVELRLVLANSCLAGELTVIEIGLAR